MKIKDVKANGAERIEVLICSLSEKQGPKAKYLEVGIADGAAVEKAKFFGTKDECPEVGSVVDALLENGQYGYTLKDPRPSSAPASDFIRHPPFAERDMYQNILSLLQESVAKNPQSIAAVGVELYETYREPLLVWSGSQSMHHDLCGGLLYHVYRMMQLAMRMVKVYPSLHQDLLLTAVALHDIGKLRELQTDALGAATYSDEGRFLGHAVIGLELIDGTKAASACDPEEVMLLKHCLASHHGKLEWGAIAVPQIEEALILHIIDYTDSHVYMYEEAYASLEPGEAMEKKHFGLDTRVYRPKFTAEAETHDEP